MFKGKMDFYNFPEKLDSRWWQRLKPAGLGLSDIFIDLLVSFRQESPGPVGGGAGWLITHRTGGNGSARGRCEWIHSTSF